MELKKKMKEKLRGVRSLNEKESYLLCTQFLQREFAPIDKRLKTGDYQNYQEYERDLKLFSQFLQEHGPKVSNRSEHFKDFHHKMAQEGVQVFMKAIQQQNEIEKSAYMDYKKKCEGDLRDMKTQLEADRKKHLKAIQDLEREKNDVKLSERKQIQSLTDLKQ